MSIACGIMRFSNKFKVEICNVKTKKLDEYLRSKEESINEIVDDLIMYYGNDIQIIVAANDPYLKSGELEDFKQDDFKKYGNLVHLATKEELDFRWNLNKKLEYSVGELIIVFEINYFDNAYFNIITLYKFTKVAEGRATWKELDERECKFTECVDFKYIEKIFHLKINQVHAAFRLSQKELNSLYSSQLDKYSFKSINFITETWENVLIFARYLISDPEVSILIKDEYFNNSSPEIYTIEDQGFIHIPKLVKEYESRTDIMGIDLGSTRCVLAVSRNREIHVIPFDNSSPGDLWTESVVSFDQSKPLFGKAAIRRFRTKPDHVIFDIKLVCIEEHRGNISKQSTWPFKFNVKNKEQPYLESLTHQGSKEFSIAEINKLFLERMATAASEYQDIFNNWNSVTKAVITVPKSVNPYIYNTIEAAKLANIEVIDIIEETHADLLYYLSKEKYAKLIKPGIKVAIFDIGGGTCTCKVYKTSEHEGKIYATCIRDLDLDTQCSGRAIDDIIIKELEESIPEDLRNGLKLRTLEEAKKIKYDLSFEEKTEYDLADIHPHLNGIVEFTKEWFEGKLKDCFEGKQNYCIYNEYPLPTQREDRRTDDADMRKLNSPFDDVDIVFLAGGTCRIPFVQRWITELLPKAKLVIDGELEIITATGAIVHALQVLSREVEPYIKLIEQQSNESGLNNEESEKKITEPNNSSDDDSDLEKETMNNECQHEKGSYNMLSNEKDGDSSDFNCNRQDVITQNHLSAFHQPEIKTEEMEVNIQQSNSKSQLQIKCNTQKFEKKDDSNDCLSLNTRAPTEHDQIAAFSTSETDDFERYQYRRKISPEPSQEIPAKTKYLLP